MRHNRRIALKQPGHQVDIDHPIGYMRSMRINYEKIAEAERKLEEQLAKGIEPDFQQDALEQHIEKAIAHLNHDMEVLEDPETIYSFGMRSFDGHGVQRDYFEAANWFRMAAEQGHAKAQYNLAVMYHIGQGVSQDYPEAAQWYRMAVEARNNLGVCCKQSWGYAR